MRLLPKRRPSPREQFLAAFLAFDGKLARAGVPALSPFWRRTVERFMRSRCRRLVLRVGRRGGKSLTLAKLALAWALFGPWSVPFGDTPVVPFVSVDRAEAAARIRTLAQFCDALGVGYSRRSEEIELLERGVVLRVATASVSGTVGFTSIAAFADEVARWRSAETGANPAAEVVASLTPTLATVEESFLVLSSSPWSTNDYHAGAFAAGDDGFQQAAHAPTWEANPTISEAKTRADERDERIWRREYAAVPSDAAASIITEAEWAECCARGVHRRPAEKGARYVVLLDVGLRHDATGIMVAHAEMRERGGVVVDVVVVDHLRLIRPAKAGIVARALGAPERSLSIDDVAREVAGISRAYNGARVFSDGHYADAVRPLLQQHGVQLRELPMNSAEQMRRIDALSARISARTIEFLDDADLKKELFAAVLAQHPGGRTTLSAPSRRDAHDECVDLVLLACDESTVRRLPPVQRDVVVVGDVQWDPLQRTLVSDHRWYRRLANGDLVPGMPPYGSPRFVEIAEEMRDAGQYNDATIRWFAENPPADDHIRPVPRNPAAAPARGVNEDVSE